MYYALVSICKEAYLPNYGLAKTRVMDKHTLEYQKRSIFTQLRSNQCQNQ